MTSDARELLDAALTLSSAERAGLAAVLLSSLDEHTDADTQETEQAWVSELEARSRRVLLGASSGESWDDVRARVSGRLTAQ